jgi:hypothetical protein
MVLAERNIANLNSEEFDEFLANRAEPAVREQERYVEDVPSYLRTRLDMALSTIEVSYQMEEKIPNPDIQQNARELREAAIGKIQGIMEYAPNEVYRSHYFQIRNYLAEGMPTPILARVQRPVAEATS